MGAQLALVDVTLEGDAELTQHVVEAIGRPGSLPHDVGKHRIGHSGDRLEVMPARLGVRLDDLAHTVQVVVARELLPEQRIEARDDVAGTLTGRHGTRAAQRVLDRHRALHHLGLAHDDGEELRTSVER